MSKTRLSRNDWLAAGIAALCNTGPTALAAEPLARALGTTKGSFYWHFKDVPDFHRHLLEHWQTTALSQVVTAMQSDEAPDKRLRQFGSAILKDPTEMAIRTWAANAPTVRAVVTDVDAERLSYLMHVLGRLSFGNPAFAHALMAALAGLPHLSCDRHAAFDALVDTLLALSET